MKEHTSSLRITLLVWLIVFSITSAASADNHWYDDLTTEWSLMDIRRITLGGVDHPQHFYRHQLRVGVGRGQTSYGIVLQRTSEERGTAPQSGEEGLMLTLKHDQLLSQRFRLEVGARLGVTGTDESRPLYAEDTDLRVHLVWFDADGAGELHGSSTFPSAYVGTILNRFGRAQLVAGAGTWWKGLGLYGTGFRAFNGDDVTHGDLSSINFANLQNAGVSLSLSYDFRRFSFRLKRNFAIENGSDDVTFGVSYRHTSFGSRGE